MMIGLSLSSLARAVGSALLLWIPLSSLADEPGTDPAQRGAEAAAAYERLIWAQTENVKTAVLNQLGADKYWEETLEGLTLTEQQQAELRALQTLADDRFFPHLTGEELSESIRAVLMGEQEARLAARFSTLERGRGSLAVE